MNMFKPVKATSFEEYFEMLPEERKKPIEFLHTLILKTVPSLKPNFLYNMPGYGSFTYKGLKKELLDWPIIGMASQKNYISLYVCATDNGAYIAEKYKSELGKVSVGKSCIRIKKIEDLNLEGLKKVLKLAEKSPGLVAATKIT
jgi:uncharacterized protein YdhG (YjbR/CyaY superfamily)